MTTTPVTPPTTLTDATYTTSTHSGATGNCVEVASFPGGHRAVRDSKHRTGPAPHRHPSRMDRLHHGLRTGDFD